MEYSGITLTPGFIISAATDPQFNYVTALLHGDGTNAGTNNTFLDSSLNNFAITRSGSTTQGSYSPFGALWSNYFNGSIDYLTTPYNISTVQWWDTDYTIEMWVYNIVNASAGGTSPLQIGYGDPIGSTNYWSFGTNTAGNLVFFYYNGSSNLATSSSTVPLNSWNHIAMVYTNSSTTLKGYINGVESFSVAKSGTPQGPSGYTVDIGGIQNSRYTGYISNVRIVRGTAVYTSNFTPSTTPLTAITNTSLLTCQSNCFVDNSTNNFTVTQAGTTSVQRFSPFGTTTGYQPIVIGGSGYFNGSTDYLSIANNAAFTISGDFTLEMWIYPTAVSGVKGLFGQRASEVVYSPIIIELNGATINFYVSTSGSAWVVSLTGAAIAANTWTHVALVRSSTTVTYYINGIAGGTTGTATSALMTPISPMYIGLNSGTPGTAGYFPGYISNLRIVNGTAVYTANFTPSTTPLPAIANTQLLLNYTNGQIFDNAMMNNFVTAGSAQISTSVVKYGTGSIAFNGTTDYLLAPNLPNLNFGTGDFTIESWVYFSGGLSSAQMIVTTNYNATTGAGGWALIYRGDISSLQLSVNSNVTYTKSWTPSASVWYHVAVSRSGSNLRFFINGTQIGTTSTSSDNIAGATTLVVGNNLGGAPNLYLNGYLDEFRMTYGYARYTSNFTPPTSQFPSTGNIPVYPTSVETLVVAGGGGGGYADGGGGGAGGYRTATGFSVIPSTPYTVTVGAGGAGVGTSGAQAGNGLDSVFSSITSIGGGGGGTGSAGPYPGQNGGSGGGSSNNSATQGIGTVGQGTNGGAALTSSPYYPASGGGGAGFGGLGGSGSVAGNGGIGLQSSISGTATYYAGGGGGGVQPGGTVGTGGAGGGGAGGSSANGISGTINTGGGGGGGGNSTGGTGGSGIVIIRYADTYSAATGTTGTPTITTAGGYRIYTWTSSGSITF
jgi:Concanavalin A-like lectin/glucanases superfamily